MDLCTCDCFFDLRLQIFSGKLNLHEMELKMFQTRCFQKLSTSADEWCDAADYIDLLGWKLSVFGKHVLI